MKNNKFCLPLWKQTVIKSIEENISSVDKTIDYLDNSVSCELVINKLLDIKKNLLETINIISFIE